MLYHLHRHLLLPAFETGLKRRSTLRYWAELERSQWLSAEQLKQVQLQALRRLLRHTWQFCPYYRTAWEQDPALRGGWDPESLQDFTRWPIIDREIISTHRTRMRSTAGAGQAGRGMRLMSKSTGGSSGVPLQFDLNFDSHDRRMAAAHRGYAWAGAEPGTRQLHLWGMTPDQSRWRRWKQRLHHRLNRWEMLNCFELDERRVEQFIARLQRCRPEVIVAYTGPLYLLARALQERGVRPWSPRAIVVGAEKLHDFQRELIERTFAAPVFETYGSREFMLIGAQCEHREGLHLTAEHLLVEILDDDGRPAPPGQEGNVVITDLYNLGMPFIRYANGDRAVAGRGSCPCGRGLPLLQQVVGRRLDILHTPDGRRVPGEFFPRLMRDLDFVRRYQVVQESMDRVEMRVVMRDQASAADILQLQRLQELVRQRLGPSVQFDLIRVTDIGLTPAGKLQVVVSRVNERWVHDARAGAEQSLSQPIAA